MSARRYAAFIQGLTAASFLVSDDGENPEYDRALVEMVCDTSGLGLDSDDHDTIAKMIRNGADT